MLMTVLSSCCCTNEHGYASVGTRVLYCCKWRFYFVL